MILLSAGQVEITDAVHVPAAVNVQVEGVLMLPAATLHVKHTDPAGFFLTIRRPPRSTLVPHATLFRSGTEAGLQTTVVEVVRRTPVTEPLPAPLLVDAA